jgi:hypothetical protein
MKAYLSWHDLNRDQCVRDQLLDWVRLTDKKYGKDSDKARKLRRDAGWLIERMRIDGPDHGVHMCCESCAAVVHHWDSGFGISFCDADFEPDPETVTPE